MSNVLEYSKKLAVVMKLHRMKLISDSELVLIKNKLKSEYHIYNMAA